MNRFKDPVCGMLVSETTQFRIVRDGQPFYFCSDLCCRLFRHDPGWYTGRTGGMPPGGFDGRRIAYFSMEVAVDERMPTYSGGLGVLAGDTLRSFADLRIPAVAVTLLYKHGYFEQRIDETGNQREHPATWEPRDVARPLEQRVRVAIGGRDVTLRAWRYDVAGQGGYVVPLILLDADLDDNDPGDRELTHWLYGGDGRYRLAQEIILGVGGVRMLHALGMSGIERFHMNEGHAALLTLELLRVRSASGAWDFEGVRSRSVFTTHTPVAAGHDQFGYELVSQVLGPLVPLEVVQMLGGNGQLNMTQLALNMSHYVNGVAKKHGEVSREMFAGYAIDSITNGVHSVSWTAEPYRKLYDRYVAGWSNDPFCLRYAVSIPGESIWQAHVEAKRLLIDAINRRNAGGWREDRFTIGFARRATPYKRADLVLSDVNQLIQAARDVGPLQIVFAGKAHPRDEAGKETIRRIVRRSRELPDEVRIVFLENYDMALARMITSGVDLWLNTPQRPLEASGTSGMKAAHNGIPSLSILDGWWIEGHIEGVTGWSIGPASADADSAQDGARSDAADLYRKLRAVILPMYYHDRDRWIAVMRQTIAFNASFFNTHRMVQQYAANAYL